MAVAAGTQALIATFAFGLVALASTSTACLFTFGNRRLRGNAPLQNGLRLVLVTFLLSAALWSIMDFAATLITANANPSCQVLVSVAAGFDQLARVAFEQFLLVRIKSKSIYKSIYVLQAFIPVRFILGGVLIAVQRPQTYPVCIAKNILLPLGIATLVTDAVIVCVFFVLIWIKTRSNSTSNLQTSNLAPARIVCFLTAGFAAWLATSIPMIFGLEIFSLASRTVVPSVGLLILIGLVALFRRHVLIADSDLQLSPSTIDTSKALPSRPTENRNTAMSQEVFNRPWGGPPPNVAQTQRPSTGPLPMPKAGSRGVDNALPIINRPAPGQTERGVGGVPVRGQLFPPTRANTAPVVLQNPPKKQPKGKLAISNPIIRQSSALKIQDKIPTVDLALAAKNDQQRRGAAPGAVVSDRAGQTQSLTRNNLDASLKRKQVGSAGAVPTFSSERSVLLPNSATTATQLSPREDELRRRSPRPPRDSSKMLLSPPPRSPKRPSGSASQKPDNAPPLIPPQSPLRRSAPVKSVLRPTSAIFIDSGKPPAIPMNLRQNNSNWSDSSPAHNDKEEIVPMVLDAGSRGSFSGSSFQRNSLAQLDGWHRRLGDALPTFSDRKDGGPSPRRTLVPAPLQLGKSSNPTRIVESQAPPLESPQHALDLIQQQLKDLDEADSETGVEDKQRRRLLENLEAEMASFFDHYSDDDDLPAADSDGSTGGYSDDEDEAFDETTLWEIANLLRSNEIPSRNSLFPGSEEDRPPSRAGFTSADEATISAVRHLPIADLEESTLGSEDNDLSPPPLLENSLWKPKTMYTTATRSAGLTQPDEMTWGRYLGKQTETLRSAPRKSEPATITSTSLWALKPNQSDVLTNAAANGLWRPTVEASITPSSTAPSTPFLASPLPTESSIGDMFALPKVTTRSHELWTPSAPVAVVSFGLPQDEQEWGRYTVKKFPSSRHKPRPSAQDAIYSTSLWVSSRPAAVVPAPPRKPASSTQPLWSKPAALPAEQTKGLWNASHIRHQYRTTDQRPAALYTARKLRTDRHPLPALRSASLWSTTTQTPARQVPDWLALSTTLRPISPGGASSSDQDQDDAASASFDSNSLRSEVTAASSVATSKQSAAHRKTASKQAAQEELDAAFRDVMQAGKPSVAMPVAVPEEENAEQDKEELEEEGQSEEKEEPREKGGAEEKEELYYDSSRLHPVFAVDVLHAIDENVHPAATGYLHYVVNGAPKPRRR
ncbi:hypothetical protein ACQRIU_002471 [Beauveria bassiana]